MTKLEIIATTLQDAVDAERNGADRLELVTGMKEGGLTPSYGLIKLVTQAVNIPVHVIIRPHSRSFVYHAQDAETILDDIKMAKELGAAGVVVGMLTENNKIDVPLLEKCIKVAEGMNITFHRAIDEVDNIFEALEILNQYPTINRILTSGGKPSALDATSTIKEMVQKANATILAGSGLHVSTIENFINETNVEEVHFGSGVRYELDGLAEIDPAKMKELTAVLKKRI